MKRRKQIGKLIYTPRWGQGDVKLSEDYESLTRDEKLEVLSYWISELLSMRNAMIPNPKSWHHFMGKKSWYEMTEEDFVLVHQLCKTPIEAAEYTEHLLKEKNA